MTNTTFTEAPKLVALQNKTRVMQLLQWNELEYETNRFETGCQYLEHYIPTDAQGRGWLMHNRIFWNWWRNHWAIRDAEFLQAVMPTQPVILRDIYAEYHDAATLAHEIYPNGKIMGTTYAAMIQRVIDLSPKNQQPC